MIFISLLGPSTFQICNLIILSVEIVIEICIYFQKWDIKSILKFSRSYAV